MNGPREPNVRIRTAQAFDEIRNLRHQVKAQKLHWTILTLGPKTACQDVARQVGVENSIGSCSIRTP
jgi:hypothetical protein